MTPQGNTSGYVFSRNPIILKPTFPEDAFDRNGGVFTVSVGGSKVYGGRFFPPAAVDLSEILDASIDFLPECPANNKFPIVSILDSGELPDIQVEAAFRYDGYEDTATFHVLPGGISKQNYRGLRDRDIFDSRFLNTRGNFFMTTRTAEWCISIKEMEILPLYFMFATHGGKPAEIAAEALGRRLVLDKLNPGIYALDVNCMRREFFQELNVLPSVFDIFADGTFSCRIVIERSNPSKERYRLKFRNSFGVFEMVELTGELSVTPDYSESEEVQFMRYDSAIGDFYTDRERVPRKQLITVGTGVKRPDEVRFLMDMLGSEEVYLLDFTVCPLKVIPSAEEFTFRPRPDVPESFTIKLEVSDSETNIMQDVVNGKSGDGVRIFSNQFTKQFN